MNSRSTTAAAVRPRRDLLAPPALTILIGPWVMSASDSRSSVVDLGARLGGVAQFLEATPVGVMGMTDGGSVI